MRLQMIIGALAAAAAMPALAQETYVLDATHSQPSFEATHLGYTTQFGSFGKAAGKVTLDRAAKTGTVDVTIDAASVKTFDTRLDAIVKGERFLNVEKFPTVTFKSSSLKFDGDKVTGVDGDLTMLGVTKPVTLAVSNFSCADNPFNKKPMCGGNATGTIKRSDWGMAQGVQTQTPGDVLTLRIPIEAYKE